MNIKPLPSQAELLALLRYEPDTGLLFWRERPRERFTSDRIWRSWNTTFAGKEAFTATGANGYKVGAIFGRLVYAHRVIVKMVIGVDADEVDHIDGDRAGNRWGNLRPASRVTNSQNLARRTTNTSGVTGVYWATRDRRWVARISVNKAHVGLGHFKEKTDAIAARKAAERQYGFHENHGRAG